MDKLTVVGKVADKRPKDVVEYLPYRFTEDEVKGLGRELAQTNAEIEDLERQKKSAAAQIAAQIASKTQRQKSISEKINSGSEYRNVNCVIRYNDPAPGKKTTYRTDDGTVVRSGEMSADEMQLTLDLEAESAEQAPEIAEGRTDGLTETH